MQNKFFCNLNNRRENDIRDIYNLKKNAIAFNDAISSFYLVQGRDQLLLVSRNLGIRPPNSKEGMQE